MTKHGNMTDGLMDFIHGNELLAIAVVIGLAVIAYFKPKLMFKLVGGVGIIIVIVYVISFVVDLTSRGVQETTKFTDRPSIRTNQ
jgi:MFS superfamily sulfate permease-like transporter